MPSQHLPCTKTKRTPFLVLTLLGRVCTLPVVCCAIVRCVTSALLWLCSGSLGHILWLFGGEWMEGWGASPHLQSQVAMARQLTALLPLSPFPRDSTPRYAKGEREAPWPSCPHLDHTSTAGKANYCSPSAVVLPPDSCSSVLPLLIPLSVFSFFLRCAMLFFPGLYLCPNCFSPSS